MMLGGVPINVTIPPRMVANDNGISDKAGVRPALRLVADTPGTGAEAQPDMAEMGALESADGAAATPMIGMAVAADGELPDADASTPQARLKELVDQDEQQAVMVLKRWSQAPAT